MSDAEEKVIDMTAKRARKHAEMGRKLADEPWRAGLILAEGSGRVVACLANAVCVLRDHPDMAGVLAHDDFAGRPVLLKRPPWSTTAEPTAARAVAAHDELAGAEWLQHQGVLAGVDIVSQAIEASAAARRIHPVREYLAGLVHDGRPRLSRWLVEYLGAIDSPYARAVARAALIQAIARVERPGIQADQVLILEGAQGAGKSSALRALANPWFSDRLSDLSTKDAALELRGVWLVELAELDHLKRAETSAVKAYVSRAVDRFRPPYGRLVQEVPRQCVFFGSTNAQAFLADETGARRFWPVTVGKINVAGLAADRDQLWAEAYAAFKSGESWWLTDPGLVKAAQEQQAERYIADTWDEAIERYVTPQAHVSVREVLTGCFEIPIEKQEQRDQNRVARALTALGWSRRQVREGDRRFWRYFPPEGPERRA